MRLEYKERVDEINNIREAGKTFKAVIDRKNDKLIVTDEKPKRHDKVLTTFTFTKGTKVEAMRFNNEIKRSPYQLICKSSVAKTYGKDFAENAPICCEVDNPYYKCSAPMRLYIKQSMDYIYGETKELVRA